MISVVIPAYNHARLILETIESVFAQDEPDVEVIVVNDGSPDDTSQRLAPLVRDGRIRLIEQENQGQSAARNRGLAEARGEFCNFLDDDDLLPPGKLAWQREQLQRSPGTVLVWGDHALLHPTGELQPQPLTDAPGGWVHRHFLRRNWLHSPGQALIRTDALREIGGFDESIWGSDDWDLFIRLSRLGEFHHAPRIALHYRLHGSNASHDAIRHARNHLKVVRRHLRWRPITLLRHQRAAAAYFVPNLWCYGRDAFARGDRAGYRRAILYASLFQPTMLRKLPLSPIARERRATA